MNHASELRPNDNFWMRHATKLALATLTVIMLLAVVTFWRQQHAAEEAKSWVNHTYEVRGHIRLLYGELRDAEIGRLAYLASNNPEDLAPYREAMRDTATHAPIGDTSDPAHASDIATDQRHSIKQELAILRELTADNPSQQTNLDEMEEAVKQLLDHIEGTIAHTTHATRNADALQLDLRHGQETMEHIRELVRIMEAEESHLLTLRTKTDEITARQNTRMIFSGMALFYAVMMASVAIYQRTRARAQTALIHYTEELEKREEELKMQQEELKASNEEIEAANEELEEKTRALEEQNAQIQQQAVELEESQKLIEEKANEIARASKYKSEFLANMSHELRTPLNSLLILAKLLAANEEGNLTEEQVEEANVIHNGGLELLNLINDILDLSKVEAGKLSLTIEEVPLEGIVTRLRQQFMPVARQKGLDFPIHIAQDVAQSLSTDVQRAEQILKNLLSNAFKFTEHGSVTLEISRPGKAELQRANLVGAPAIAFSVIDTGIGIEASKFKDIFEAFQQEDGSIDRHYGGTGLGLTIARKFAHMLGGEIHVLSTKNVGSRFTLVLPLQLQVAPQETHRIFAPEPERIPIKPMPKSAMTEFISDDRKIISAKDKVVLIIEDDKNFASTLVKIARRRGYKCLAAGDGKTGLLLATEEAVTAIILDLSLPDIDGVQVLDQLKHDLRTRHIPVHIISGRDQAENVVPLRKGAIGYLTKPAEIERIDGVFTKIETLLAAEMKRVLLVEDDQKNQLAIENLLRKKDVEITTVGTARAAMEALGSTSFDCIILDLQLPDMTGFEWLETVGKAPLPPVIIYTARELTEEENRKLSRYTGSIIIKGAKSPERLLDEVTLFLHSVESTLSADQQEIIRMQHHPDKVLQGRTLLLTDDDLRNTFALSKLLRAHGMHIIIADNGQMALDKLRENPAIELVIMDIMMPVMDGYEAMHAIRALPAYKDLPIITLTARAMPEEQEKCMAAGANDYLTKPVDIERLLTLLRVWLFKQELAA